MRKQYLVVIGLVALSLVALTSAALAGTGSSKAATFAETVRQATEQFKDVRKAERSRRLCAAPSQRVGGPQGVPWASTLPMAAWSATVPWTCSIEALLYEQKNGKLQLVGVEYVVLADDWNAPHDAPPVLMGQLFNLVGAPSSLRPPRLLRTARLGLEEQPRWYVRRLESARVVRGVCRRPDSARGT